MSTLWEKYLSKALDEKSEPINDIGDDVKGLKSWLDDLEVQYSGGNFKDAKKTISSITKRLNEINKSI